MMDRVRINNSLIVWSLCIRKSNIAFNSVMCIFPPFTLVFSGSGAANSFAAKQPWHQKSGPDGALKESIQPVICGEATALANRRGLPRGSFWHTHTQKCRPKQGKLWSAFPIFLTFSVSGSCGLLWLCFCFAVYLLWSKYKTLTISDYKRCYDGCLRLPKWLRRKQRLDAPWWNHWGKNDGKPDVFRGWHVGLCCTCRFLFVKSYHITSYHETMAKIDTHWHIIKPWCILLSFHLMLLYF